MSKNILLFVVNKKKILLKNQKSLVILKIMQDMFQKITPTPLKILDLKYFFKISNIFRVINHAKNQNFCNMLLKKVKC